MRTAARVSQLFGRWTRQGCRWSGEPLEPPEALEPYSSDGVWLREQGIQAPKPQQRRLYGRSAGGANAAEGAESVEPELGMAPKRPFY